MFPMSKPREGFSMRVNGMHLNRPDLHLIASELGVMNRDVITKDGKLIVYNTSESSQEIVADNNLASFVAMALDISSESITEMESVVEVVEKMEFDIDLDLEDE